MAVSSPALPPEEQKSPTSGDAEMRRQPIVHDIAATSGDANGSNNMQTTSANTPNPSPAEHAPAASAAKKAGAAGEANGTSAPVQTVAASATNSSNPIINLSSDADKSDATPVPDNEGGQKTSTSAAPKGGASTSDRDQDDDKKAEAAKKPKYTLGQAIEKVRRFII